jgi:hypothetical protein
MTKYPLLIFIGLITFCDASFSQIQFSIKVVGAKLKFNSLDSLPLGKTYNIVFPDSLTYLKGKFEIKEYWRAADLYLKNKRDEKKPSDYTFQVKLYGINIKDTQIQELKSSTSPTGMEYSRNYFFNFPCDLIVIDNNSKKLIRTIVISSTVDEFKREFHKNFFIKDELSPNFKNPVGYDSLSQLLRIQEMDIKVLKHLEGSFTTELFEKVKNCLVQLYGSPTIRVSLYSFYPKEKNRKSDFSDFDGVTQKMMEGFDKFKDNKIDESKELLKEAEDFYEQKNTSKSEAYLPLIVHGNLLQLNLVKEKLEAVESYFEKINTDEKPTSNFSFDWKGAFSEHVEFLRLRKALEVNRAFYKPQKAERASKKTTVTDNLTRGFVVTAVGDTLFGKLRDFNSSTWRNHSVKFINSKGEESNFTADKVSFVSGDSIIYESVDYQFDGVFLGERAPGKKLLVLLYSSSNLRFYFFKQTGEFIYYFPQAKKYKRYKPFSLTDGSSYLTNQNKKLSDVFSNCPAVIKVIESGAYDLKKSNSVGHIMAVTDYENACGSKDVERNFKKLFKEEVVKKYH